MKTNCWMIFSLFLSMSLLAQPSSNSPVAAPPSPAGVTNVAVPPPPSNAAPAKAEKKKGGKKAAKTPKKPVVELRTIPLVAGPAVVIASNVNVRGQAKLKSEVVGKLTKGQNVTVLDEVTLRNSAPDEPSAWAKIVLPAHIHVWANTMFINASNKTVQPAKLNLRGGPGENYSVLGVLKRGDAVKELSTKGEWIEIEPPSDAYAFVAAQYLSQEGPVLAGATPTEPTEAPATVTDPAVATAVTDVSSTNAVTDSSLTNATSSNALTAALETALAEPLPKRIVQREGIVRGTISIQAPTHFELASPENGRTINYLYTTSSDLDLRRYKGFRIIVTGEEGLDERWRNTPVITIQKIHVVE